MQKPMQFFIYTVPFLALAPAASPTFQLNFDQQSDFFWVMSAYGADVAAAGQTSATRTYPLIDLLITPTSTAQFMNAAVPVTSIFGNGENPFILPAKTYITRGTTLTFQATNRDAAQTYNLRLQLIGYKVF